MTIYKKALATIPEKDIAHHESDLYLRKTPETEKLIDEYKFKNNVSVFRDAIDHVLWYEVPFAYEPFFIERYNRLHKEA